jgi:hypothetical protein
MKNMEEQKMLKDGVGNANRRITSRFDSIYLIGNSMF